MSCCSVHSLFTVVLPAVEAILASLTSVVFQDYFADAHAQAPSPSHSQSQGGAWGASAFASAVASSAVVQQCLASGPSSTQPRRDPGVCQRPGDRVLVQRQPRRPGGRLCRRQLWRRPQDAGWLSRGKGLAAPGMAATGCARTCAAPSGALSGWGSTAQRQKGCSEPLS